MARQHKNAIDMVNTLQSLSRVSHVERHSEHRWKEQRESKDKRTGENKDGQTQETGSAESPRFGLISLFSKSTTSAFTPVLAAAHLVDTGT